MYGHFSILRQMRQNRRPERLGRIIYQHVDVGQLLHDLQYDAQPNRAAEIGVVAEKRKSFRPALGQFRGNIGYLPVSLLCAGAQVTYHRVGTQLFPPASRASAGCLWHDYPAARADV